VQRAAMPMTLRRLNAPTSSPEAACERCSCQHTQSAEYSMIYDDVIGREFGESGGFLVRAVTRWRPLTCRFSLSN